jgi:hypothetical protein
MLLNQPEARLFIKMPCRAEPLKCPQIYLLKTYSPAKADGRMDELVARAFSPHGIRHDEPSQMGPLAFAINPIDCNRAFDTAVYRHRPKAVSAFVIPLQKLRKLDRHLSFEEKPKSPLIMVVDTVKFGNSSNGARNIAFAYRNL